MATGRKEIDVDLIVKEGRLPEDIYGHVFICYPVGSVNSNGVPFPEFNPDGTDNPEYGSPLMNGDGMVMQVSFDEKGKAKLRTKILKPPCYYADEATKWGSDLHSKYGFRNFGVARISPTLGARDFLNTALIPVQFRDNKAAFVLATYDVGRPYAVDPATMLVKTPIGSNKEWTAATPPFMHMPFALIQSSAHPVFDAETKELFTVNYTRSLLTMLGSKHLFGHLAEDSVSLEERFEKVLTEAEKERDQKAAQMKIKKFYDRLERHPNAGPQNELLKFFVWIWDLILMVLKIILEPFLTFDKVQIFKWTGEGKFAKWQVKDENNKRIRINQCMHQMSLTKDYIFLTDTSFKFSIDMLMNNPFPHNKDIDERIRNIMSTTMQPFTDGYIVKRSDLDPKKKVVKAKKLKLPIPLEVIHYSSDYLNPDGKITIYCVHNAAACIAEWLRPYDISQITGQPIDKEVLSMFALGDMDIGRFGKFVIDANKSEIIEQNIYCRAGDFSQKDIGPQTWGVGLYAYRDMISSERNVNTIEDIYFTSSGPDPRMLSQYIFNLYKDYPNRIMSLDKMIEHTKNGVPFSLTRVNTKKMEAIDHYQFEPVHYIRSVQYMPRKRSEAEAVSNSLSTDGYIFCTVQVGEQWSNGKINYSSECWIFDASNLHQGPVCKLTHPEMEYCFTLHSAWLPETGAFDLKYHLDIEQDYNEMISNIFWRDKREEIQDFFDQNVYPYFKNEGS